MGCGSSTQKSKADLINVIDDDRRATVDPLKIVMLGDSGIGKSCIVVRYAYNRFSDFEAPTIGAAYAAQRFKLDDGSPCELAIWDTSGQEKYNSLTSAFLRNALGAVIVYDITNKQSFEDVDNTRIGWLKQFGRSCPDGIAVLVGNKADLADKRQVSKEEAAAFAASKGMRHFEVSAKLGDSVPAVFEQLAKDIVAKQRASS